MDAENLGEYIKRLRTEKGITLKGLSETIGYSEAYISMVERGKKNNPSYEFLSSVAKGMAITDGDERANIHGKLMELAGFSKMNYADSFFDLAPTEVVERAKKEGRMIAYGNDGWQVSSIPSQDILTFLTRDDITFYGNTIPYDDRMKLIQAVNIVLKRYIPREIDDAINSDGEGD